MYLWTDQSSNSYLYYQKIHLVKENLQIQNLQLWDLQLRLCNLNMLYLVLKI